MLECLSTFKTDRFRVLQNHTCQVERLLSKNGFSKEIDKTGDLKGPKTTKMPPKKKGGGKKKAGKKTGGSKGPTIIDGVPVSEMTKEQLEGHVRRLQEEVYESFDNLITGRKLLVNAQCVEICPKISYFFGRFSI